MGSPGTAALRAVFASVFFFPYAGCNGPAPTDPVIANIGGEPLTLSEFESYVRSVTEEDIPLVGGELKSALLEQLIEELLLLRAAEDEGVEVSPQEMQALEREAPRVADVAQTEEPETPIPSSRRSPLDLTAHLKVRKLVDDKILKGVEVTDDEIASYYEDHRAYYKRPEAVDISQILVQTEEEAKRLHAELSSNASRFEELAETYSLGPEAPEGGRLGTFRRGELPSVFDVEVFEIKRGELSQVVQTDFGFHIFRVNAAYPATELDLDEVKSTIRVDLLRQKSDEALALFLEELKQRYPVRIDTEKLDFPYMNQGGYDVEPRGDEDGRWWTFAR